MGSRTPMGELTDGTGVNSPEWTVPQQELQRCMRLEVPAHSFEHLLPAGVLGLGPQGEGDPGGGRCVYPSPLV